MLNAIITAFCGTRANGDDRNIVARELSKNIDKNVQELSKIIYERLNCETAKVSIAFDYNNDCYPQIRTLVYDVILTYYHRNADIFNVSFNIKDSCIVNVQIESGEGADGLY